MQDEAFEATALGQGRPRAATAGIRTRQAKVFAAEADLEVARRKVKVAEADVTKTKARPVFRHHRRSLRRRHHSPLGGRGSHRQGRGGARSCE